MQFLRRSRPALRSAAAAALIFLAVNAIDLTTYPLVTDDEVILNDPARVLATQGIMGSQVLSADARTPFTEPIQPPGQTLLMAAVYRTFGFGLVQTRLPGVIFGALAVGAVAIAGAALLGQPAGFWGALFFALLPGLSLAAKFGRMDAYSLFGIAVSVYLFARCLRTGSRAAALGSGIWCGAAILFHLAAASFALGVGLALALTSYDRRRLPVVVYFLAGVSILPAIWLLFVWHHSISLGTLIQHGTLRGADGGVLQRGSDELGRWFDDFRRYPFALLMVVIAIFVTASNTQLRQRRALLTATGSVVLFNLLFLSKMSGFYLLYPLLMLSILVGGTTGWIFSDPERPAWHRAVARVLWVGVIANAALVTAGPRLMALAFQRQSRDYGAVTEFVKQNIPAGSVVWGTALAWYAVIDANAAMHTPSLWFNQQPDPQRDAYVILNEGVCPPGDYRQVSQLFRPLPVVQGTTFSLTNYNLLVCAGPLAR